MFNFKNKKISSLWIFLLICIITLCSFTSFVGWGKEHRGNAKNIILGLDLRGGTSVTYEIKDKKFTEEQFEDTKNKLEERANTLSTESEVYAEGDDRITVNIPGYTDANAVLEKLGSKGKLSFVTMEEGETEEETSLKTWLEGSDVADAQGTSYKDQLTGKTEYAVDLTFTDEGTTKFAEATTKNVGNVLYVVYDDELLSSPKVNEAITGGSAQITGMTSIEEANELASMIRIGNLDLELEAISHKVVGAKLGNDALEKSLIAGLIGLILVCLFMIVVYRVPGVIASFSLYLYVLLVLETLNAFDITLTLPGIAGIILGIGMAVDANVIIYTRIKEEITKTNNLERAIMNGFKKANSAIIDGNITTLIAAVILMWKGSGTVQGFAQTLGIGIVWSMFTALIVSRILLYSCYYLGLNKEKLYGRLKPIKTKNFLKYKKVYIGLSLCIICLGGVLFGTKGFNYSVEFQGGKAITVEFDKEYSINKFNDEIKPEIAKVIDSNDIIAQKDTDSNSYTIKLQDVEESKISEMKELLVNDYKAKEDSFQETFISPTISNEMTHNAIVATVLATIAILLYIWFRFKNISYATSAIIALIHDILIVITFYLLSRISVGTTFIACILTIVGYSINATIVIFDRIRENSKLKDKKTSWETIINNSISETLTRTINTSLTTFITIFIIFIMGVPSLQEFTLPLMVGVVCGTYSSICLTGSLLYLFQKRVKQIRG